MVTRKKSTTTTPRTRRTKKNAPELNAINQESLDNQNQAILTDVVTEILSNQHAEESQNQEPTSPLLLEEETNTLVDVLNEIAQDQHMLPDEIINLENSSQLAHFMEEIIEESHQNVIDTTNENASQNPVINQNIYIDCSSSVQVSTQEQTQIETPVVENKTPQRNTLMLLILDGFGHREESASDNAIAQAKTTHWDIILKTYPNTLIQTSEHFVGLPSGQMGNSEVGHLNIGAGRIVHQDFTRVDLDIESGNFVNNQSISNLLNQIVEKKSALHVLGLLSDGGVHSHNSHIKALLKIAKDKGIKNIFVHAFLDGRDTPPQSALNYIKDLEALNIGRIATVQGRFYAMDRDNRWERTEQAYDVITRHWAVRQFPNATSAVEFAYSEKEFDEFVKPTAIMPQVKIQDGDGIVFMNFRADRARQLTRAFTDPNFNDFERKVVPNLSGFVTLTSYGEEFKNYNLSIAYEPIEVHETLGEVLSKNNLKQLRIAETEKYAHVTYFFNGGVEQPYENEDRILVPSPKVKTYDLQPEMSASEVINHITKAIYEKTYDVIIANLANGDMVGHTGNIEASIKAVETLDECLGRLHQAIIAQGGKLLITADHGNIEMLQDHETQQAHTAHTLNPVPFVYISADSNEQNRKLLPQGEGVLADIAPTMLKLLNIPQPTEMTGKSIIL